MAVTLNQWTGWSDALAYTVSTSNPTSDNSYAAETGTIFPAEWFNTKRYARKFINPLNVYQRLRRITFTVCPVHSNGKYMRPSSGAQMMSSGGGCNLTVDLYLQGESPITAFASVTIPPIDRYNCYYMGYGNTDPSGITSFGSPTFFGPGMYEQGTATRSDIDSQGRIRYRREISIDFPETTPAVAPGDYMYLHIRPTSWTAPSSTTALLIWATGSYFTYQTESMSTYLNIFTADRGWRRSEIIKKKNSKDWQEMGDDA